MRSPAPESMRPAVDILKAGAVLMSILLAPAGASVLRSPLTVPAVSLLDVAPNDRSLVLSITRGSASPSDADAVGVAGVHLPQAARVTALVAFAIDESGTQSFEARLFRRRIGTAQPDGSEMAVVLSSGSAADIQELRDESVEQPSIDNGRYIYWVAARLPDGIELFGLQLEFAVPLFLDGFESADTSAWLPGGVEPGFVSPLAVNFADAASTTPGTDGCWSGGGTGSTVEGYIAGGWIQFAECCFTAPVHLPHGVAVTAVVSYLVDAGDSNLTLSLRRKSLANQVVTTPLATTTSSGSGESVRLFADGTIDNGVIDNDTYTYFLSSDTCLDPDYELLFYQTLIFFDE
ncbi:MAG: hypothetical protein ABIV06_04815 [Thermoanaerobaculia bacterium]